MEYRVRFSQLKVQRQLACFLAMGLVMLVNSSHASGDDFWEAFAGASAHIRIRSPQRALDILEKVAVPEIGDGKDQGGVHRETVFVLKLLKVQAKLGLGRFEEAKRVLDGVKALADEPNFGEAFHWVAFQLAVAADDVNGVIAHAEFVFSQQGLRARTRDDVRLESAKALLKKESAEEKSKAMAVLRDLSKAGNSRGAASASLWALAQSGDSPASDWALRQLVVEYGETHYGSQSLALLPEGGLSKKELRDRAINLMTVREYDLAKPDFLRLAKLPEHREEALLNLSLIRMRLRDNYQEALGYLDGIMAEEGAQWPPETLFRKGIALGHLGRFKEGSDQMRAYLQRTPRAPLAVEAGFQVGRLLHEGGAFEQAAQELLDFSNRTASHRLRWLWFAGWSEYRAGNHEKAREVFSRLFQSNNLLVGPKALYWTAKSHFAEGNKQDARDVLAELQKREPVGYYGLLGASFREEIQRAEEHGPQLAYLALPSPKGAPASASPSALAQLLLHEKIDKDSRLGQSLKDLRILVAVGHLERARNLASTCPAIARSRKRDRALDRLLDQVLENHGTRWRALAKGRIPWDTGFAGRSLAAAQEAYPLAYWEMIKAAGQVHDVSPWWLLAHMLQESRFSEIATSHAGAMGAIQILPRTGRRIAEEMGDPQLFHDEMLYDPGFNISQAAWYLAALREEFGGFHLLAAAAYNGGPLLLCQHLAIRMDLPGDVLIEEIGPHEMRNYSRKIADHVLRYLSLYATKEEAHDFAIQFLPPPKSPKPEYQLRF